MNPRSNAVSAVAANRENGAKTGAEIALIDKKAQWAAGFPSYSVMQVEKSLIVIIS